MYRINTKSGDSFLTESITYVRKHSSGEFLITDKKHADGVAYRGKFYLFSEGAQLQEVDTGADILETEKTVSDNDAMSVDQEYRLTLLELGLVE